MGNPPRVQVGRIRLPANFETVIAFQKAFLDEDAYPEARAIGEDDPDGVSWLVVTAEVPHGR